MSEPQKNWRPVSKTLATRNVQITKSGTEGAASSRNESGPSAVEVCGPSAVEMGGGLIQFGCGVRATSTSGNCGAALGACANKCSE